MSHERLAAKKTGFHESTVQMWRNVLRSPEYAAVARARYADQATLPPAEVLRRYQEAHQPELTDAEHASLGVLTKLGSFVDADRELKLMGSAADGHRSSYDHTKARLLKDRYLIPFNHALKDLINHHPNLEQNEFVGTLAESYAVIYGDYDSFRRTARYMPVDVDEAYAAIQRRTVGMKHEIAAETMLAAADVNYDYDVSVAEDAGGNDIYIELFDDRQWLGVNLKASELAEQRALREYPGSLAVWTGLQESDFKGMKGNTIRGLTIPYATASAKGPEFVQRIKDTVRHQSALRVGHHALTHS